MQSRAVQPVSKPFAAGHVVEEGRAATAPVGPARPAPDGTAFADGIQRWEVVGHLGVVPVIHAYVAAAVLVREGGRLRKLVVVDDEFLVVAADGRLDDATMGVLGEAGLRLEASAPTERAHPMVDRYEAARVIEGRRETVERRAVDGWLDAGSGGWLILDGPLGPLTQDARATRIVGLIKTHETQFLDGADLRAALTLAEGHRSSVFERTVGGRYAAYSWYLRLWPWHEEDLLHGLTRLERRPDGAVTDEADLVSRWVLAERAPIAAPDARWDRLIYPIREVETYLRSHAGDWS